MQVAHVVEVESPVVDSFRVQQIAGLFDVPVGEKTKHRFEVFLPARDEPWSIGAIIGPSGSGKTTIGRSAYPETCGSVAGWKPRMSILDSFPDSLTIHQITDALTAVGFSSPPDWLKPYEVLSNGQRFRADLARALVCDEPVFAFDEFTSVVDRQVAMVGSAAIAKAVRKTSRKFVAVTCHHDVIDWLQPDWVLDMGNAGALTWREVQQRPPLSIELRRVHRSVWRMFAPHHYLSAKLATFARCYGAFIEGRIVGFCAVIPLLGQRGKRRVSRVVVLPDWQGIGVGKAILRLVGGLYVEAGLCLSITGAHPSIVRGLERSSDWRLSSVAKTGFKTKSAWVEKATGYAGGSSAGRSVASFDYVGPSASTIRATL